MSVKNCSDTIGNRTRDVPTCSAVSQPTALPRAPSKRVLSRNTSKMQLVVEFIIPKFTEDSTCFERHTAHHQEL
jgi:hypothetical protein